MLFLQRTTGTKAYLNLDQHACANGRAVNGRRRLQWRPAAALARGSVRACATLRRNLRRVHETPCVHRAVTLWGLRDADFWRRPLNPLLFDDTYARKPACDAVIAAAKKTGP
ncbi:MAG: endo-1,4-beta-xylanase [Verrucomicrobia bacterium]|nr:endo-1,4-beta-xylanase [Verrucomicrobiota bacterium]